ncbi:MAG: hypothetical protein ACJ8KO_10565 [Sulfurifustaceae bacterium]
MSLSRPSNVLRFALTADAAVSGATGLLMVFLSGFLDGLLQVPPSLLFYAGLVLIPYAAFIAVLARRESLSRGIVTIVIAGNVLWATACVLVMLSGWVAPNWLGYAFIAVQAIAVVAFAELQYVGLRKSVAIA